MSIRITRRGAAVALVAGVLVLAAPAAAQAHVGVSPDQLQPGGSAVLTFSFSHGCDGSPTTSLRVTMPDGLTSVAPTADANWDIDVERAANGLVSAVTYTATTPVENGLRGAVTMSVSAADDAAESLVFPVVQQCETGVEEWTETAESGEDPHDLDSPAPVVTVTADDAASVDAGHGSAHDGDTDDAETSAAADVTLPTVLGAGGLVAGVAALVVAVLALRRRA